MTGLTAGWRRLDTPVTSVQPLAAHAADAERYGNGRGDTGRSDGPVRETFVRPTRVALAALVATLGAAAAAGQTVDPKVARSLAATCANCHGTGGVSVGDVESLAGKPREEIVRKMQEFKSGARPATVMNQLAKGYTDEQIEALAGWFAAQKASK